jgi:putative DNA primase/helicase
MIDLYDDIVNGPAEPMVVPMKAPPLPPDAAPSDDEDDEDRPKFSTVLIKLVRGSGVDVFVNDRGDVYATLPAPSSERCAVTTKIRSREFADWLQSAAFKKLQRTPGATTIDEVRGALCGEARESGDTHEVHRRVAATDGGATLWLDLCTKAGDVARMTAKGWDVTRSCPVKFARGGAMKPLPMPQRGGSIDTLRQHLNVADDASFTLVVAWMIAALRPGYAFPILAFEGEHGTAKSSNSKRIRALIDPNEAPARTLPREEGDILVSACRTWIMCFDNLSGISDGTSDALCRVATGGGLGKRALYTDDDEVVLDVKRPLLLNGIDAIANRQDLADRLFLVRLEQLRTRRTERALEAAFDADAPGILGALLDGAVAALANIATVHLDDLPRMADAAQWATAAEPGLGWTPGRFMAAWRELRRHTIESAVQASPVLEAIRTLLTKPEHLRGWEGTARQLLNELNLVAGDDTKRTQGWPKASHNLGSAVHRGAPMLRELGYKVSIRRTLAARTIELAPPEVLK